MKLSKLPQLIAKHPLTDEQPWYVVVDLDLIESRFRRMSETFPNWLHAVAVKAHPLHQTLQLLVELGAGMEAASWQECERAFRAGCSPQKVVFDSPVKTRRELRDAVERGVLINADNLSEVARLAEIVEGGDASVGLRVNPEVAPSSIGALSTGSPNSKFGVSLSKEGAAIEAAFRKYPWLDRLHVHIGSKGYGPDELARGLTAVTDLGQRLGVTKYDIGGGLPPAVTPEQYRESLQQHVPMLFDDSVTVVTEFGRWLFTHAAVAVSRVEYVKQARDCNIVTIHFGADFMLRNAYQPGLWTHPIELFDSAGARKYGESRPATIAGPLCFGGDVIARDLPLPQVEEGDVLVVRDVGAYTFALWSKFCSRPEPTFVLWDGDKLTSLRGD